MKLGIQVLLQCAADAGCVAANYRNFSVSANSAVYCTPQRQMQLIAVILHEPLGSYQYENVIFTNGIKLTATIR